MPVGPGADAAPRAAPWLDKGAAPVFRGETESIVEGRAAMTLLLVSFAVLLVIGLPIALAMMGASLLFILVEGIPLSVVAQRVVTGVQSFPLLAIPLFTLAGSLMNDSGISERLFSFTRAFVGHIRGGMAQTAIVGNVFLSGISGSSVADCAATSRVFVPQLSKAGYGAGFAAALCAACATLGPIIPPSILMVDLRLAGEHLAGRPVLGRHLPGPRDGAGDGAADRLDRAPAPVPEGPGIRLGAGSGSSSRAPFWALMMPVLILVGFRMGVFTATEIAGVAAAYSLIVGLFFYRTLRWSQLPHDPADHRQGDGGDPADRRRGLAVQLDPRHRAGAAADLRSAQRRRPTARGWCCCC